METAPRASADPTVVDAIAFAVRAHGLQLRKDGRTPYVVHPLGVLRHLAGDLGVVDAEILEAGVLHDVLEDTPTVRGALAQRFGERVTRLVQELTVPPEFHGPHVPDERKTEVLVAAIGRISWPAVLVKLCDRWDNLRDLANAPWSAEKRERYTEQTRALLAALARRRSAEPPPVDLAPAIRSAAEALDRRIATDRGPARELPR